MDDVDIAEETEVLRGRITEMYGADVDVVALAAIAVVNFVWRNDWHGCVEEAHTTSAPGRRYRISDGEMFAANVATTRLVLGHIRSYPNVGWDVLTDALVDPQRVAGQRTVVDLLGKMRHRRWATWPRKYIGGIKVMIREYGTDHTLLVHAAFGASDGRWWAGPDWPGLVDAFVNQLTEPPPGIAKDELRIGLLDHPEKLEPEILDWCTTKQLIGYTRT